MHRSRFTRAVDKLRQCEPLEYSEIVYQRARFLRSNRLTTIDSLHRRFRGLNHDDLVAAIRLLPYLDRAKAGLGLLTILTAIPNAVIRLEVAKAMASLESRPTTKLLLKSMRREKDPNIRYWLAYTISCLADESACEAFVKILNDESEETAVRSQIAEGLGYMLVHCDRRKSVYRSAERTLIEMLDCCQAELRFWAIFALGNIRATRAIVKLRLVARKDKGVCPGWWSVRQEATDAINVIKGGEWPNRVARAS